MTIEPVEDDFFAELNKEIAAATAKSALKADAAKLKRDANNMRLDARTRARAAEEFRSVQAIIEANQWVAIEAAAMFTEQVCDGCGSIHHNFLQYMLHEQKLHTRATYRWTRIQLPPENLKRITIVQPLKTHLCSDCAVDHGFNAAAPEIRLLPMEDGLTVSSTYAQGDINERPTQED